MLWMLATLAAGETPTLLFIAPAEVSVEVIDAGRGAKRALGWDCDEARRSAQLSRTTTVVATTRGETPSDERIATLDVACTSGVPTVRVTDMVADTGDVLSSVQLHDGAIWWSEQASWVLHPGAAGRVELGVSEDLDIGPWMVAQAVLDGLAAIYVPVPNTPVGRGATWAWTRSEAGAPPIEGTATLVGWRRGRAVVSVAATTTLPEEAGASAVTISGKVWLERGLPVPSGAELRTEIVLGGETPATGVLDVVWATR